MRRAYFYGLADALLTHSNEGTRVRTVVSDPSNGGVAWETCGRATAHGGVSLARRVEDSRSVMGSRVHDWSFYRLTAEEVTPRDRSTVTVPFLCLSHGNEGE